MKYPAKPIIGIAREGTSPENRLETNPRVALLPSEVSQISQCGFKVIVEEAAGKRMHISDSDYAEAGALITMRQLFPCPFRM